MSQDHKITRRAAFGLAAASAASVAIGSAALSAELPATLPLPGYAVETPEIVTALQGLAEARKALDVASTDLDWFKAEWRHRWPSAPEEILGIANADRFGTTSTPETDILGAFIYRSAEELPQRMGKRAKVGLRLCFAVETPAELTERAAFIRGQSPRGRLPHTLEKDRARLAKYLALTERQLATSEAYFAERARILELSGAAQMLQRHADAKRAVVAAFAAVSRAPVTSVWGLRAKALAYLADALAYLAPGARHRSTLESLGGAYHAGYMLALHTAQTTQPADGNEWPLIANACPDALAIATA